MNGGPGWLWKQGDQGDCSPIQEICDRIVESAGLPPRNTHLFLGPATGKRTATEIMALMGNYPPQGNGAWGFPNLTGVMPTQPKTDQEIDDSVREAVDGLDRERQIIAYRYLHGMGMRIGSTLDYELSELRRERKKGDTK
jgi:hypothetical protein